MTPEKVREVCSFYIKMFEQAGIPKKRVDVDLCPKTKGEMFAHAHFLLEGIEEYLNDPEKWGKANRHLGSAQTLLWVSGRYTLREIMSHNNPDGTKT